MNGFNRDHVAEAVATTNEVPISLIDDAGLVGLGEAAPTAEMEQLVRNIQEQGLLQPIVVAPMANGHYRIVAGHKRYLACRWLGWKNIPVLVHQVPDARTPTA
jgi:ParB family chromosome partitioning protein